jgi:type VI secretion system protein VasI
MLHPVLLLASFCVLAALGTPATAAGDPAECVFIDTDLDRLACYDRVAGRTTTPKQADTPPEGGAWVVQLDKSEFKDTTDVYLSLVSDDELSCGRYNRSKAVLMLRCMENTTALFISTNCHLTSGHGGYGRVEYRIDDRKSVTRSFTDSTDNRALGLWSGGKSIPMIKQMLDGEVLLTRFTPFSESAVTARFQIKGLDTAIAPLREACNW